MVGNIQIKASTPLLNTLGKASLDSSGWGLEKCGVVLRRVKSRERCFFLQEREIVYIENTPVWYEGIIMIWTVCLKGKEKEEEEKTGVGDEHNKKPEIWYWR